LSHDEDNRYLEEWKQARDVLKTFDDRVHDLRKYGFTFITGLITVQGLLLPWIPPSGQQGAIGIPDPVKFGVLIATSLLIIVLRWFDGNYQGFLYGAATRAKVIERFMNLELTDEISVRYEIEKLGRPKIILYAGFQGAVIGLAFTLLPQHIDWPIYLLVGSIAESLIYYFRYSPEKLRGRFSGTDWAIDRLQCSAGEQVRIMMTNLSRGDIHLEKDAIPWMIKDKNGEKIYNEVLTENLVINPGFSYVWDWKVPEIQPGIYRIVVNISRATNELRELARKIQVTPKVC
jgi:hypothetical protein